MSKKKLKKKVHKPAPKKAQKKSKVKHVPKAVADKPKKEKAVSETFNWDKEIDRLVARAVARGFLTEAEVIHNLGNLEENITGVERLLDALDAKGIELVEQEVASVW